MAKKASKRRKGKRVVATASLIAGKKSLSLEKIYLLFAQAEDFREANNFSEAEKIYRAILEVAPNYVPALIRMAQRALGARNYYDAYRYARQAVEVDHASSNTHQLLGEVLALGGLPEHAESELTIALQLDKQNCIILNSLATVCAHQGRFDEAIALLRQAITINPDYLYSYANLVKNKRFTREDQDFVLVNRLLENISSRSIEDQIIIHFTLGKVFHDCGEYDRAFVEYQQANDLKSEQNNYSLEKQEELVDSIFNMPDNLWLGRWLNRGNHSEHAIFIVGMPRSGTTLLESLLNRHPQISGIGEPPYIYKLASTCGYRFKKNLDFPEILGELTSNELDELGGVYINWAHEFNVNTQYTVDKTPANFIHLGFILSILPDAKLLHSYRDPVDTCLSIYQQHFDGGVPYAYDLRQIGQYYLLYRKIMEHWKRLFPEKILDVNYEDVVMDSEGQLRRVIEFCGLPWDDCCLDEAVRKRVSRTVSSWQAMQPVYKTSVMRWKKYEKHLGPLLEILEPVLER